MKFLHRSFYFPVNSKMRKPKIKPKSVNCSTMTPEPLKIKKFELFDNPHKRPSTSQRVCNRETIKKTNLRTQEKFIDSFGYYIENYAVTNLPPFEVIEHYNTIKAQGSKEFCNKHKIKTNFHEGKVTQLSKDFSASQIPILELELFNKPLKIKEKQKKKIVSFAGPSKNNFQIIGNPLSLLKKQSIRIKKPRIKTKMADIHLQCPKLKLSRSFSLKSN